MPKIQPHQIELLDDAMVEVIRRMTPTERLARIFEMNATARLRLAGHFATRHPEWTPDQVAAAVARRMLGESG